MRTSVKGASFLGGMTRRSACWFTVLLALSWTPALNGEPDNRGAVSQLATTAGSMPSSSRPSPQIFKSHPPRFGSISSEAAPGFDKWASQAQGKNLSVLEQHLTPALLKDIRGFWYEPFETEDDYILPQSKHAMRWYMGGKELDDICVQRFGPALEAIRNSGATTGEDVLSIVQPRGPLDWLSIILLLDQISRNSYRGAESKLVYGFFDPIAQDIALAAIEQGIPDQDVEIRWRFAYRNWFYMPLMHSESMAHHEAAVDEFGLLAKDVEHLSSGSSAPDANELEKRARFVVQGNVEAAKGVAENGMLYEKKHKDIIAQFGRYPHRNKPLGREPTVEETEYLENGGETFTG